MPLARPLATAFFLGVALVAFPRAARAAPPLVDFTLDERASGCPTAEEFRAEVDHQIGDDLAGPATRIDVRIGVEPDGTLAARLELADDPGRAQTLRAPPRACRDLAAAAAIAVSLVLRAAASAHPAPPSPPPPPPIVKPPPPATRGTRAPRFQSSLAAGLLVGRGVVPDLAAGPLIAYRFTFHEHFALVLDASETLAQVAYGERGAAVRVTSRTVALAPCVALGMGLGLDAVGCAFVSGGDLAGTGENVRDPETKRFASVELGYRLGARIPLGHPSPLSLRIELRNGFPLVRSRLDVDGDTVWRSPPVTLTGGVLLETSF